MEAVLSWARLLLPFPFPVFLAVGAVVPVALAHQRHPHPHVQRPVTWENGNVRNDRGLRECRRKPRSHWSASTLKDHQDTPKIPHRLPLMQTSEELWISPGSSFFLSPFYSSFTPSLSLGLGSPKCALKAPKIRLKFQLGLDSNDAATQPSDLVTEQEIIQ